MLRDPVPNKSQILKQGFLLYALRQKIITVEFCDSSCIMKFRTLFKGRYLLRSAENLTADGYTFVSCVTAPEFRCEDFRLVPDREIRERLEQG